MLTNLLVNQLSTHGKVCLRDSSEPWAQDLIILLSLVIDKEELPLESEQEGNSVAITTKKYRKRWGR